MSKSIDNPPPHNASSGSTLRDTVSQDAPPLYTPPTKYVIGSTVTLEPLVKIVEIKGHLALLHAFSELKRRIDALDASRLPSYAPQEQDKRWVWFVGLAVERFDIWCRTLRADDSIKNTDVVLPPIDVLMVWHSYMLNPRGYAEDCLRIEACKYLKEFEVHFTRLLNNPPSEIYTQPPSEARVEYFYSRTSLPFDILSPAVFQDLNTRELTCPKCNKILLVSLMTRAGKGYLQQGFTTICCGEITKKVLAIRKLALDVAKPDIAGDPSTFIAGTFFPPSSADLESGRKQKQKMRSNPAVSLAITNSTNAVSEERINQITHAIMKYGDYDMAKLRTKLRTTPPVAETRLLWRIIEAYNDDKIYSVELIGAVIRQHTFVNKMCEIGWTRPGFFDHAGDELALHHALARYHAFLDLMSSSPVSIFVPTLDIDLVWHTHQLLPSRYESDCGKHLNRFIDHDDKVEGLRLSSAFDITCGAWKERFGVQYSHCGCTVSGDTIGKRLSNVLGLYSHKPQAPSHLPPFDRADLLPGTHPSDHNAVVFTSSINNERAHKFTTARYEKLAKRKEKGRQKSSLKAPKERMEATNRRVEAAPIFLDQNHNHHHYDYNRNRTQPYCGPFYDMPFLVPVPLYTPVGGIGGCVGGGNVVNFAGGCSNCGCAGCGSGGCASGGVGAGVGKFGGGCGGGALANAGYVALSY